MLSLYHGASLFTGFVFFLTGAIESSEARRELAVKSARSSSWEGMNLRYDSSFILGYGTEMNISGYSA